MRIRTKRSLFFILLLSLYCKERTEVGPIQKIAVSIKESKLPPLEGYFAEKVSFPFQGDGSLGNFTREDAVKSLKDPKSYMYAILYDTQVAREKTSIKDFLSFFEVCQKGLMTTTKKYIHCEYENYTWDIGFENIEQNKPLIRFFDINYK